MIVDCHAHLVPPDLLTAIRKDAAKFPNVRQIEAGGSLALAFVGGKPTRPVSKPLSDIPARLAWMAEQGIDKQVVGGWVDMFGYELPGAEGRSLGRLTNDCLLAAAKAEPHFVPLATVPLGDGARAAAVLKDAMQGGLCRRHDRHVAARRRLDARCRRPRSILAGGGRDGRSDPYPSELRRRRHARERFRPRQRPRPHHRRSGRGGAADLRPAMSPNTKT